MYTWKLGQAKVPKHYIKSGDMVSNSHQSGDMISNNAIEVKNEIEE